MNEEGMDEENKARIKYYHEFMCVFFSTSRMDLVETTVDGKDMQSTFVYLITLISLEIFFFRWVLFFSVLSN